MLTLDLSDHIALVTGGSGELGRVICRRLAACGAAVAVHYRSGSARAEGQDIANTVCFLASDLARFITGVYLPVCGGNVMPCV